MNGNMISNSITANKNNIAPFTSAGEKTPRSLNHPRKRGASSRGARYASPFDVVNDDALPHEAKRIILSSWASDLFAVESSPWLRKIPDIEAPIALSEIFAALRTLDNDDAPPPGGAAQRQAAISYLRVRPRRVSSGPSLRAMAR